MSLLGLKFVLDTRRVRSRNAILARLDAGEYRRLQRHLEHVTVRFNDILYDTGDNVDYVYFPESGVISLVTVLDQGGMIETGLVGSEGMAGLSAFLGARSATGRAVCQIAGTSWRLKTSILIKERRRGGPFNEMLLRYTAVMMAMVSQNAACNRAHPVDQRLSRWLLMSHDRLSGNEIPLTQGFLASMLGVHRPSVNLAGRALQKAGFIRFTRGKITVVDRPGLEGAACECYGRIRAEFTRAFGRSRHVSP
jgi:CRP-like cAMP-binding protein